MMLSFLWLTCVLNFSIAAGSTLMSNPLSTNGVVTVCPEAPLSITCSHDKVGSDLTRWEVTGTGALSCQSAVFHSSNPLNGTCGPFTIFMISDVGSELSSTAQLAAASETLDGLMVECLDSDAVSIGVITIQIVDPTPVIDSVTYSVNSSVMGSLRIMVKRSGANGTDVTYSGSVVGGSVQVIDGNVLSVTGLDYNESHTVDINSVCSGLQRSSQFNFTFNTTELTFSQPTPSIQCSIPSLPVTLTWDFDERTLSSSDPKVPLSPPVTGPPSINFTSVGGDTGYASSTSPLTLYNLTVDDLYTFTVFVTNVAGVTPPRTTSPIRVSALTVDTSTVASQGCLTFTVGKDCAESISSGDFAILLSYGVGQCQSVTDFTNPSSMTTAINSSAGVCIPVETMSFFELCYTATLMYQNTVIMNQTNQDFQRCAVSTLVAQLGSEVTFVLSSADSSGTVAHTTIATLECTAFSGDTSQFDCVDGVWTERNISCSSALIIVIIVVCLAVFFAVGIIVGILLTLVCGICVQGIQQRKCGTLLLVILLIIMFGLGIGILIGYCCVKNKKEKDDKEQLESQEINPPPADSLYADPNTIEHEAAPGTEDQYAMVDRKVKKNTKPKPTPPEALYQDPNTIEHETAASGDTYAVVDKPKRSSKKKGGPDVVPPATEGLTYAEIDLSSKRPKPGSGRQAPQQPGEYPKEHPVEYSSVDHGNTSQL